VTEVNTSYRVAVTPKTIAVLLRILYHFQAYALPCCVTSTVCIYAGFFPVSMCSESCLYPVHIVMGPG
jgi:hypothetical protein